MELTIVGCTNFLLKGTAACRGCERVTWTHPQQKYQKISICAHVISLRGEVLRNGILTQSMRVVRMEKQPRALNRCVPASILYAFRCFRTYRGGRRLYGKLKLHSN